MTAVCTIGTTIVTMIEDMFDYQKSLDERGRFQCDIWDEFSTLHFVRGERVTIVDDSLGLIYNGFLSTDKEVPIYPDGGILHSIDCIDLRYLADKRSYTETYLLPTYAGKILADIVDTTLVYEGINQNFAVQNDDTTANFNNGINTNTAGYSSVENGDLELLKAGSDLVIIEDTTAQFATGTLANMTATSNSLVPTTTNALKLQSTLSFAFGTQFAQTAQTSTGTAAGSISTSGSISGSASGSVSGSVNPSGSFTPSGSISISGGSPGESANFFGNSGTVNTSGGFTINPSLSLSGSASTSGSASLPFTGSVTKNYAPKIKSKVSIDNTHHGVVSVDVAVADNRVDATIWTGSQTIGSNDTLNYDIFISSTSPSEEGGVDLVFSDGTTLTQYLGSLDTNTDVGVWDINSVSVSPIVDLADYAKDTWYHRQIDLSILSGKIVNAVTIFNAANIAGVFDIYFKNIFLGSHSGSPFFSTTATAPTTNPPVISSIGAYVTASTLVTVTAVYNNAISTRISPAYSIDSVKLIKNSFISWNSDIPINGPNVISGAQGSASIASQAVVFVSFDGLTWLACTNNKPLPGLPSGSNVTGQSIYFYELFSGGQDPSAIPAFLNVTINLYSAPNATTTDITDVFGNSTQWNSGTENGTAPNANGDLILGKTSYSWSNLNNMTYVPGGDKIAVQSVSSGAYVLTTASGGTAHWTSTRFNFISAAYDFTAEADFNLNGGGSPAQHEAGFVYRQTYWGSPNNSFAYYISVQQGPNAGGPEVSMGYGINSPPSANVGGGPATGTYTHLISVSETITNNTTYHVKLVVAGDRHTVYWNNGTNPIIDLLDDTYTAAGNIGIRTYMETSGSSVIKISNFTVTNTFAGIWTSPSLNLNSLGTVGNTQVAWSEVNPQLNTQATAIVVSSLDGGTTWKQCTNGAVDTTAIIPGLSVGTSVVGKSILFRIILSANGFLNNPVIMGLFARICGSYPTVTGNRSTQPEANDMVISRTVASGWGTSFGGETITKVGTATTSVGSGVALLSDTTGDVHMVYGSRQWTDEDETIDFSLSANTISAGLEIRYVDANNLYRLSINTTSINIIKISVGTAYTLASVPITINTGTQYWLRFRVVGSSSVNLYGKYWAFGTLEPGVANGMENVLNPMWSITTVD